MARRKKQHYFHGYPVKYKDTSIELALQRWLTKLNIPFRTQEPILGPRDIFIPIPGKPGIIVEADGCFFHKCPACGFGKRGRYKDKRITKELECRGYIVMRFWEHEMVNLETVVSEIQKELMLREIE